MSGLSKGDLTLRLINMVAVSLFVSYRYTLCTLSVLLNGTIRDPESQNGHIWLIWCLRQDNINNNNNNNNSLYKGKYAFGHAEWSGTPIYIYIYIYIYICLNVITQRDFQPFSRLDIYSSTKHINTLHRHMRTYHRDIWSTEAELRLGSLLTIAWETPHTDPSGE